MTGDVASYVSFWVPTVKVVPFTFWIALPTDVTVPPVIVILEPDFPLCKAPMFDETAWMTVPPDIVIDADAPAFWTTPRWGALDFNVPPVISTIPLLKIAALALAAEFEVFSIHPPSTYIVFPALFSKTASVSVSQRYVPLITLNVPPSLNIICFVVFAPHCTL